MVFIQRNLFRGIKNNVKNIALQYVKASYQVCIKPTMIPNAAICDVNYSYKDYPKRQCYNNDNITFYSPSRVNCGELRSCDEGKDVEVVGKVIQQKMGRFIHLKDGYGVTQIVAPEYRTDLIKRFLNMPLSSYISVIGKVFRRPLNNINTKMLTGDIEIVMDRFEMVKVNRTNSDLTKMHKISSRPYSTSTQCNLDLTPEEYRFCSGHKYYEEYLKQRKITCGSLGIHSNKHQVEIVGWMHKLKLPKFLHIKDGYGIVQCILNDDAQVLSIINTIKADSLIRVSGVVSLRPDSCVNMNIQSGNIEIMVTSLNVVNPNEKPTKESLNENTDRTLHPMSEPSEVGLNGNCWRSHTCGELRQQNVGERVMLYGWLEHHRMNKFFTLRDGYGSTQCVINSGELQESINIKGVSLESILQVEGSVTRRPTGNINSSMSTGEIEVVVSQVDVVNPAVFHPFSIRSFQKAKESLRMQYRYLDLRFPEMQNNLRTRSQMIMKMRKYLCDDHQFVEVDTPTLFCRTPGGAQEFIVPTRHKGLFYSLVQSPQQFKQILMAGSIDRYFQVAHCYRDEDIRGDRQPEFSQLDIEMSFVGREEIMNLTEGLLRCSWPHPLPAVIPRITYKQSMETYGTDKPDLNINLQILNVTPFLHADNLNEDTIGHNLCLAITLKNLHIGKSLKQHLSSVMKRYSLVKKLNKKVQDNIVTEISNALKIDNDVSKEIVEGINIENNDWLFLAYGPWEDTCLCMGEVRTLLGKHNDTKDYLTNKTMESKPLWVIDFPLFTKSVTSTSLETCHHPFTAPHPQDVHLLDTNPLSVRSLAYDLVMNGNEIGGGSVRAHNVQLQRKLLTMLNIPEESLNHLLQALSSGCPPHAGIALGLDRFVMLACGATSIRDVIAFPKTMEGRDLLSGAPTTVPQHDKHIYHISVLDENNST